MHGLAISGPMECGIVNHESSHFQSKKGPQTNGSKTSFFISGSDGPWLNYQKIRTNINLNIPLGVVTESDNLNLSTWNCCRKNFVKICACAVVVDEGVKGVQGEKWIVVMWALTIFMSCSELWTWLSIFR